jgi:hypothetical protein
MSMCLHLADARLTRNRHLGFVSFRHDLNHERVILPEHVVNAGLKSAQYVRRDRIEAHDRGRMLASAPHALNRIERREAVVAEKRPDFFVGRFLVYVAEPKITHRQALPLRCFVYRINFRLNAHFETRCLSNGLSVFLPQALQVFNDTGDSMPLLSTSKWILVRIASSSESTYTPPCGSAC